MSRDDDLMKIVFARGHDPSPPRVDSVSETMFNRARNLVVRTCANHGTVGPSGELPDGTGVSGVLDDPDFYVVDDWYGEDMRILVEPRPSRISADWLRDMVGALRLLSNWDVLVTPGEGISLVLRPDHIEISGWIPEAPDLPGMIRELQGHIQAGLNDRAHSARIRETEVKRLLPGAWLATHGNALGLVGVFRTVSDGTRGDSVWILHFEDKSEFDFDNYCFEPDAVLQSLFRARRSGEMAPDLPDSNPIPADTALLAEWALVADGKPVMGARKLLITKRDQTWHFDLKSLKQVRA